MVGHSAHASRPHEAVDSILAAVMALSQLQLMSGRLADPSNPFVLSVGAIEGGTTHNIIAERCTFKGTVRCRSSETRAAVESMLRAVCNSVSSSTGTRCEIQYSRGVPGIVNNDEVLDAVLLSMRGQFGEGALESRIGQFESEDFAYFSELIPSCQLLIGSGRAGHTDYLHNSRYEPDERCLGIATRALVSAALGLLGSKPPINRTETQ
jgi:amidohydrolase